MATIANLRSGSLRSNHSWTIWYDPHQDVIKLCTGDPQFTDENGGKPGAWITVHRGTSAFNRFARALHDARQLHPPID